MTFAELLRELGVEYALPGQSRHVTAGWVGIDCPACSPGSRKYKLGYCVSGRFMTCWTCGHKGVADALSAITGRPKREIERLCVGLTKGRAEVVERARGKYLPPPHAPLGDHKRHQKYLKERGFRWEEVERLWGVAAIGPGGGNYAWRLFLPVRRHGRPVSWTTRAVGGGEPRYLSAPPEREDVPLKSLLYGADFVRGACVVVEGPLDAIKIGPGAVATFGTSFTKEQIAWVARVPVRAVCFDSEGPAQRAADELCRSLECFPGVTHRVVLESAKDAGDADPEELAELRARFLAR